MNPSKPFASKPMAGRWPQYIRTMEEIIQAVVGLKTRKIPTLNFLLRYLLSGVYLSTSNSQ